MLDISQGTKPSTPRPIRRIKRLQSRASINAHDDDDASGSRKVDKISVFVSEGQEISPELITEMQDEVSVHLLAITKPIPGPSRKTVQEIIPANFNASVSMDGRSVLIGIKL